MNGLLDSFQNAIYNNPLSKQIGGAMGGIQNAMPEYNNPMANPMGQMQGFLQKNLYSPINQLTNPINSAFAPITGALGGITSGIQDFLYGARPTQTSLPNVPVPGIGQGMYKLPDAPMQNTGFMGQPTGGYRWMGY